MNLPRSLFLAAFTSRSQAYAQSMANSGIKPEKVVFFGDEAGQQPGQTHEKFKSKALENYFVPDFSESLIETARKNGWDYEVVPVTNIKDPAIYNILKERQDKLVIFSGYGSQLVPKNLIGLNIPFLHFHAGWLPDYRGSTTLFYTLINEFRCGVSALFLNEKIDEGKIVAKAHYPAPVGIDADYAYDSLIRGDLLAKILIEYNETGKFPLDEVQEPGGLSYYVIHPMLKHLALLKCEKANNDQSNT